MRLPLVDSLIEKFHSNMLLDPLLKNEANNKISMIDYCFNGEPRIRISMFGNRVGYIIYYKNFDIKEPSIDLELYDLNDVIPDEIISKDFDLINRLFGTNFKHSVK